MLIVIEFKTIEKLYFTEIAKYLWNNISVDLDWTVNGKLNSKRDRFKIENIWHTKT